MRWMVILLVAGCTISEENFAGSAAGAACALERRCDADSFEDSYDGDFDACVEDVTPVYDLANDVGAFFSCEYDPAAGSQYVRSLRSLDCGSDAEPPDLTEIYICD